MSIMVSILMTSYNREKFISEAIESVLASTYSNFELIIVDDCSSDNTVAIAKKYAEKDQRIHVYVNDKNLGDYPNRNKAATYAKGKYIKYIDADDMIYPWGLEIIINSFEKFPNVGYCLDSIEQDVHTIYPMILSPKDAYSREYFRLSIFNKAPTSATIRLEVFNRFDGFSGKQHIGDFELWHKLSLTENVLLLPHGIVWSREHDEQESKANRTDSYVLFKYMLVSKEFLQMVHNPLELSLKTEAINRINRSISRSILRSVFIERNISKAMLKRKTSSMTLFQIIYFAFFAN